MTLLFALALAALRIVEPPDGAILNRHDGENTTRGLWITVKGTAPDGVPLRVNGRAAAVRDGAFETRVLLNRRQTRIVAESGASRDAVTVLWDRDSIRRYRFSIDDNILWLKDIAQKNYPSLFDNPYMAFWREMHRKYGAKIHFNIYYETPGFNLSQFPDKYRAEWQANRDWIRLSFHARANDPDKPYKTAPASQVIRDYRLVMKEIERFAGKELTTPVTTIHWGEATREACAALRKEGITTLAGYFEFERDGSPRVSYYLDAPHTQYLSGRDYWKDVKEDILFVRHDMVVNNVKPEDIVRRLEKLAADPHQSEVLELMIHEQYFYPDYRAYEPEYKQRVENAIQWATRKGYKPVFFGEGFLGAP
ncbi:MAG: hypothetical protein ACE15B_10035 [Bryobacteraceae bacterium]